ncbi:DUF3990 domain-containing protein [Butyrivibrio sp. M55]|uniref:DUF3990 domain-containing protein n=1 Tax=Butyrivibrio sp. M55 TaxID=1855323 RepID=UPI0008E24E7F|nr:DUF3990 domain-containing protein [Butyrivibrio sp. M55]SFU92779.1 Protein of unknown function [Butyrivibrio sp. M55]
MILYHGSNVEVPESKLLKVQRELDFGKGFYTTSDKEQATKWAIRTARRLKQTTGYVTVYEIDEQNLLQLKILRFDEPSVEWLKFVSAHRKGEAVSEDWDLIIGPVADDRTMPVIELYLDGAYDEEEAIKRLLPQNLKDQYTFKTDAALGFLVYKEIIKV